jgi:hypothetical protein
MRWLSGLPALAVRGDQLKDTELLVLRHETRCCACECRKCGHTRDLRMLVKEAAGPVASEDADVIVGGRGVGPAIGWFLAEGPVRPAGVVVIGVFAADVAEMGRR